ncbi:RNA-binding protein RO60 [Centruroides vittatus]|uniref:RNA-binding protein RO60 n=1 Tax=Centruroides vittatus TaxID=120091 RepID=UPI00350FACDC
MAEGNNSKTNLAFSRLHHFLYLGTEGNCYNSKKPVFSLDSVHSIESLIADGKGKDVVQEIIRFASEGLSLCPDAILYALAVCAHSQNNEIKSAAFKAVDKVCSTSVELFAFNRFLSEVSKPTKAWGRARRRAISSWYSSKSAKVQACEVTKIIQRHRWTHLDLFRLSHHRPVDKASAAVIKYVVKGIESTQKEFGVDGASSEVQEIMTYLKAVHELKHTTDEHVAARLIETHDLSFEHIPTPLLKSKEIWTCLIQRLPLHVLLRKLPRLHRLGFLKNNTALFKSFMERLRSESALADGHLGPIETFIIARQHDISGKLDQGKPLTRYRSSQLDDALHNLHMASFKMVPSTGKRYLVAVDVRNPMDHNRIVIGGVNLSPSDASALLIMALVRAEGQNVAAVAFSTKGMANIDINNKMTLSDISCRMRETPMGPVNMAAPLQWAQERKRYFDIIIVCTDNQTQPGDVHPAEALKEYRKAFNLPQTRFVICAMSSQGFSLAPPDEPGMLDIAGFNVKTLQVIQDFARGIF